MRLLVVEPNPSHGGGSEGMALAISKGLAKRGHQLLLAYEKCGSMLSAYDEFIAGRFPLSLPGFPRRRLREAARCVTNIGHLISTQNVDAVISSHLGFISTAALVTVLYKRPWLFHLGLASSGRARIAYRIMAAGVAPSEHTAKTWAERGWPAEKLHVIPNWVDSARFRPAADRLRVRSSLNWRPDGFYIVFIGRLCREKGVEVLLDAFLRTAAYIRDAHLIVVGPVDGAYKNTIDNRLKSVPSDIRGRMIFYPPTGAPEKYLEASDLACIPPLSAESFGLTLIEAMSCGLPVVATTVGVFPEIVGEEHSDLLVAPGDCDSLSKKLDWWFYNKNAREDCGQQLRARILRLFAPEPALDLYESVLYRISGHTIGDMV